MMLKNTCIFALVICHALAFTHNLIENESAMDVVLRNLPKNLESRAEASRRFFTQKLDHFDSGNGRTWNQEYFVDTQYYVPGGPVFLYMGGESDLTENYFWFAWAYEYAKQLGAICLALEHRFYGQSYPVIEPSLADLKAYLSATQALADAANFIQNIGTEYNIPGDAKWITFGGSYHGTLAAWMRQLYPELVHGAISSSGPFLAEADYDEYLRVVHKDFDDQDTGCNPAIVEASHTLREWFDDPNQHYKLCNMFNFCDNYYESWFVSFYFGVTAVFMNAAQYNNFNSRDPQQNIHLLCQLMTNVNEGTPVERLAKLYNGNGHVEVASGYSSWTHQKCYEFGWFKTSDAFTDYVSLEWIEKTYCTQFDITPSLIQERIRHTNGIFGGKYPSGISNIVYVNGDLDPWSAMGATVDQNPNDLIDVVLIKDACHCQNMSPGIENGWPEMAAAKELIVQRIYEWWMQ